MRKRPEAPPVVTPRPCGHPAVTIDGETASACMWGRPGYPPLAVDAPEFAAMEAAANEHTEWGKNDDLVLRLVAVPYMLDPFGQPWPDEAGR